LFNISFEEIKKESPSKYGYFTIQAVNARLEPGPFSPVRDVVF